MGKIPQPMAATFAVRVPNLSVRVTRREGVVPVPNWNLWIGVFLPDSPRSRGLPDSTFGNML